MHEPRPLVMEINVTLILVRSVGAPGVVVVS